MADGGADQGRPNLQRRRKWQHHSRGVAVGHELHRRVGERCLWDGKTLVVPVSLQHAGKSLYS